MVFKQAHASTGLLESMDLDGPPRLRRKNIDALEADDSGVDFTLVP